MKVYIKEEDVKKNHVESKIIVLDTSVLLYDKNCLESFEKNDLIIPLKVLEELDRFKDREGILGESARHVNRFLDNLRSRGNLNSGVSLGESYGNIKIWTNIKSGEVQNILSNDSNDNIIICTLLDIIDKNSHLKEKIIFVTKDINLRVKCDALNIKSDDYYADYEFIQEDKLHKSKKEVFINIDDIDKLYCNKKLKLDVVDKNKEICQNDFIILKSDNKRSALTICNEDYLYKLPTIEELYKSTKIEAKNKEQLFALHILLSDQIPLVTMTGIPGSGKTYLTLMAALNQIEKQKKKRIIFTRPIQTVGKDIGFLPGDINEKMAPWLAPIVDNFRNQFGDLSYFDIMMERGDIDIAPLSYIRGRSFNDSIIIVDEAQNATIHELKTVITRTGKNSKIVLLGDIEQVDLPYVDKFSNGLTIVTEKMKNEKISAHIHFEKGYRSELANIASRLL